MDANAFSSLTPEQLHQYMQMAQLQDEDSELVQQLRHAEALQKMKSPNQFTSPAGALLGGIGTVFGNIASDMKENRLRKERKANLNAQTGGREAFARSMGFGAPPNQQQPTQTIDGSPVLDAPTPFSYGADQAPSWIIPR